MNYRGISTPWGPSQGGYSRLPGTTEYHTAGHGGMKVASHLNRQIPLPFRNLDGWYEEDCECSIPLWWFHERFVAHTTQHQADKMHGYLYPPMEHWSKFTKAYFEKSVREWQAAAWAVYTGLDMEDEVRERSRKNWTAPHFDAGRLEEFIASDIASYHRQLEFILAKREPVSLAVGDVLPLDNCQIAELTIQSLKPMLGRDAGGQLWRIPRKLIAWARFPRSAATALHRPARRTPARRAALALTSI